MSSIYNFKMFSSLKGEWLLERFVYLEDNSLVTMTGAVDFSLLEKDSFKYQERVSIYFPDRTERIKGYKEYCYKYRKGGIEIYFLESHLLFHRIIFKNSLIGTASHQCKEDVYSGLYNFNQKGTIKISYKVLGPSKNYTIETTLRKKTLPLQRNKSKDKVL